MSRFKLTIEYEGTRYSGWQMQKGGKTIQGEILDACKVLAVAPEPADGARPERQGAGDVGLLAGEADAQEGGKTHQGTAAGDGVDRPGNKGRSHDGWSMQDIHSPKRLSVVPPADHEILDGYLLIINCSRNGGPFCDQNLLEGYVYLKARTPGLAHNGRSTSIFYSLERP